MYHAYVICEEVIIARNWIVIWKLTYTMPECYSIFCILFTPLLGQIVSVVLLLKILWSRRVVLLRLISHMYLLLIPNTDGLRLETQLWIPTLLGFLMSLSFYCSCLPLDSVSSLSFNLLEVVLSFLLKFPLITGAMAPLRFSYIIFLCSGKKLLVQWHFPWGSQ